MQTGKPGRTRTWRVLTDSPVPFMLLIGIVTGAIFVAYLLAQSRLDASPGLPLDDSWIHLTFARNLVRGWGFAFNQGQPVAGSTAPLWTLLLALLHLVLAGPPSVILAAKVLSALFMAGAGVYAGLIALRLTDSRWPVLAAGLAVVTFCHFGWAMVSGMEVCLSVFLGLAAAYYYLKQETGWRGLVPWLLFGLAVYARPENLALGGLALIDTVVRRLFFRQKPAFWRSLGVWILMLLPWFGYSLAFNHTLFPQTYFAKAGAGSLFAALAAADSSRLVFLLFKSPWLYLREFAVYLWRANPVLAFMVPVGITALVFSLRRRKDTGSLFVPLVAVFFVPIAGAVAPYIGPGFQHGRYIGTATALALVLAAVAGFWLVKLLRPRLLRYVLAVGISGLALWNVVLTGRACALWTAGSTATINRIQVALGQGLATHTSEGAVVACEDVGAIGFFSNRQVVDLMGLVTPDVLPFLRRQNQWGQGHQAYLEAARPDYIVVFPGDFRFLLSDKRLTPVAKAEDPENLVCQFDFRPRTRTLLGVLVTRMSVEPRPSTMVVLSCDWAAGRP